MCRWFKSNWWRHAKDHRSSTSLKQSIEGNDILNLWGIRKKKTFEPMQKKHVILPSSWGHKTWELLCWQTTPRKHATKLQLLSQFQAGCCIASSDTVPWLWTNHHPQHPQSPRGVRWPGDPHAGNIPKLMFAEFRAAEGALKDIRLRCSWLFPISCQRKFEFTICCGHLWALTFPYPMTARMSLLTLEMILWQTLLRKVNISWCRWEGGLVNMNDTRWSPLPQLASNRWSDHHHRAAFPHALMAALHATALDCYNMTSYFALMRLDWLR